jgi:hypothetical protein
METTNFKCRIEELPFLATLLLSSFTRDKVDFVSFSETYGDPFTTNFSAKVELVESLVNPKKLTGEMKKLTQRLKIHFTTGRNLLNKIEIYIAKALEDGKTLSMAQEDFGIKAIRQQINAKNDEGTVLLLRTLKTTLADNLVVLVPKGYSTAIQTALSNLIDNLNDDSIAQTSKKKQREKLVADNTETFNALWKIMTDIMKSGKAIYQEKDKAKVPDYTYEHIIKDVHLKRAQEAAAAKTSDAKTETK